MIQVREVTKSYGAIEALRGISFSVAPGQIVGLLGPNGAGKTTTIKILTGCLQPDAGSVTIGGLDVLTQRREVQAQLGYLPESAPLYPELTVQGYLQMMADLRGVPPGEQLARLSEAIRATSLADHLTRPIGQLSKGYRQRVGLAQAILHRPRLLVLDEPSLGLDPTQIVEIRHLIRRLAQRSTILFSTHILSEVEALCDRVIILINGRVRADARLRDLATSTDAVLVLERVPDDAVRLLQRLDHGLHVESAGERRGYPALRVRGSQTNGADLCPRIYDLARRQGWPLRELTPEVRTLEMIFNELATTGEAGS